MLNQPEQAEVVKRNQETVISAGARTSRSTGTSSRGDRSRAAILRVARQLFAARGYRGASMASVAAAADLTQPGLLHHFSSKQILLEALLEEHYHADGHRLNRAIDSGDTSLVQALEALVEHNAKDEEAVRFFSVLVAESLAPDHPGHEHFRNRYRKVRERLTMSLRVEQEAGRVRADTRPDVLAAVVIAVMDGLQTQWLLDPDVDMDAGYRAFAALLTDSHPDRSRPATDADGAPRS